MNHLALILLSVSIALKTVSSANNVSEIEKYPQGFDKCSQCEPLDEIYVGSNRPGEQRGLYASGCSLVQIDPYSMGRALEILDLKDSSELRIHNSRSNSMSRNQPYQEFNWRLYSIRSVHFGKEAFVNARINLYIFNTSEIVADAGAFVNCKGTLFLAKFGNYAFNETAFVDSDISVIVWKVSTDNTKPSSDVSLVYRSKFGHVELQPSSEQLEVATFGIEVVILVVCLLLAVVTTMAFLSINKLFRQTFQSIRLTADDSTTPKNDVLNSSLPPPPRPTPKNRPKRRV